MTKNFQNLFKNEISIHLNGHLARSTPEKIIEEDRVKIIFFCIIAK